MTTTLTVKTPPAKRARIEKRAAELGFADHAKYLMHLVDRDLAGKRIASVRRKFSSADMIGCVAIDIGPGTNANIRRVMRERLKARHGKNR
jgi:hypothetical protein